MLVYFFFHYPAPTDFYTLSLHDALPISQSLELLRQILNISPDTKIIAMTEHDARELAVAAVGLGATDFYRSEEHTSELQSRVDLVCRLLLEKKKKNNTQTTNSLK